MQFSPVAVYWRKRLSCKQSPPSAGAGVLHTHQSPSGCRRPFCWQMRRFAKKHRGIFVSSLQWTDSGMIWFAGFLNVLVEGCCLLQTKAVWAWHSRRVPQSERQAAAETQQTALFHLGKGKIWPAFNCAAIWGSSLGCRGNFFLSVCCKYV